MLEIVKKRAALRPSDTMVGSDGGGGYDVSDECSSPSSSTTTSPTLNFSSLHPSSRCLVDDPVLKDKKTLQWRELIIGGGAKLGALFAMVVLVVAFVYPALVLYCLES